MGEGEWGMGWGATGRGKRKERKEGKGRREGRRGEKNYSEQEIGIRKEEEEGGRGKK